MDQTPLAKQIGILHLRRGDVVDECNINIDRMLGMLFQWY